MNTLSSCSDCWFVLHRSDSAENNFRNGYLKVLEIALENKMSKIGIKTYTDIEFDITTIKI